MLTFKDPNGVECVLQVRMGSNPLPTRWRHAEPADLLSALGQISTGSDGPTDETLEEVETDAWHAARSQHVADSVDENLELGAQAKRAARRALFAAGLALGEQKQAARVRELEAELAEVKRHSRNQRGQLNRFNRQVREDYEALPLRHQLESELAATKAKLAEVERELNEARSYLPLDEPDGPLPRRVLTLVEDLRYVRSELASARRVVEAVNATLEKGPRYTDRHMEAAADAVADEIREAMALASAGTHADRTEAPRDEAGESGPDLDRVAERLLLMRRLYPNYNVYTRGPYGLLLDALEEIRPDIAAELRSGEAPGDIYGRHFDDETGEPKPTAEPKPEPQPSAPERQPEVERDDGGEQE